MRAIRAYSWYQTTAVTIRNVKVKNCRKEGYSWSNRFSLKSAPGNLNVHKSVFGENDSKDIPITQESGYDRRFTEKATIGIAGQKMNPESYLMHERLLACTNFADYLPT